MKISSLCTGLLLLATAGQVAAAPVACVAAAGTNCPARIADAPQDALVSTMTVPDVICTDNSVPELRVTVDITHSAVGDLAITVANPASATSTLLTNLPGSAGACRGGDVNAVFRDDGTSATCSMLIPAVSAATAPVTPLTPLTTTSPAGVWTLTIVDSANNGDGALNDWIVDVDCVQGALPPTPVPFSWQALLAIAVLLALGAFGGLRRAGFAR